mgnify:CR=1 FL=1
MFSPAPLVKFAKIPSRTTKGKCLKKVAARLRYKFLEKLSRFDRSKFAEVKFGLNSRRYGGERCCGVTWSGERTNEDTLISRVIFSNISVVARRVFNFVNVHNHSKFNQVQYNNDDYFKYNFMKEKKNV